MTPDTATELQLRDIHLPPTPDPWPPAPGWWLLAALLLILVTWIGLVAARRLRRRRRRRRILALLREFDRTLGPDQDARFAAEVSALLRRLALTRYPREQVAGLTGEEWLAFLDRHGGDGRFRQGPGRALIEAPYAPAGRIDRQALLELAESWILHNSGGRHDP